MTRARDIADLVDANGDIVADALDNVPAADVVNDTTPQLGGDLDTNGNDVNFGDNDKATFGDGDLQIYHDALNSYIVDSGTGDLIVQGGNNVFIKDGSGNNMLRTTDGAQVRLYYGNATRLDTTSTGITVTGTVAATSYTGDGSALTGIEAGAKAWANTNQTGTQSNRDSFNIDGITDNGVGNTTLAFTNNMSNGNFSTTGQEGSTNTTGYVMQMPYASTNTSSQYQFHGFTSNRGAGADVVVINTAVHGDLA